MSCNPEGQFICFPTHLSAGFQAIIFYGTNDVRNVGYKPRFKRDWQFLENIFYYVLGVTHDCFKTEEKVLNFLLELSSSDHIVLITTEEQLKDKSKTKPIIYLDI